MPLNLYDLIFKTILGLSECSGGWWGAESFWSFLSPGKVGCITGDPSHDIIFSLFLPHVILIFFLYLAFRQLGHRGIESLLGVGAYIFIIQMGWYPAFADLTIFWLMIVLVTGIWWFIVGKIISPAKSSSLFSLGRAIGGFFGFGGGARSVSQIKTDLRNRRDLARKNGNHALASQLDAALKKMP